MIRIDGRLREVQAEALDADRIREMIQTAAAGSQWKTAASNGPLEWDFTYGYGARFHLTVLMSANSCFGLLRRIGNPDTEAPNLKTIN